MATSKLKSVLDTFSLDDIRTINDFFLSSPIQLSNDAQLIWSDIIVHKDHKDDIDRNSINIRLFDGRQSDSRVRNILSEIFQKTEQWIVLNQALKDQEYSDKTLLKYYRNKGVNKLFQGTMKQAKQHVNDKNGNSESLQHEFNLLIEEYNLQSSQSRSNHLNLQEILDHVDIELAAKKLRQACFAAAHTSVTGQEYNMGLLPSIIDYIYKHNLQEIPAIGIYMHALGMINHPSEEQHFIQYKELLPICEQNFPTHELRSLYLLAINHCIKKINSGQLEYGDETLNLYNTSLEKGYLLLDGYLSRYTYSNIATIALKLGRHEWALGFSERYKAQLRKEERESTYHFNLAKINYNQGALDSALMSLQYVDFSDHLFSLKAKTLQLKIYYETESFKSLYSHLDAMQMYLLRKKVIGYHKNNYKNLIKYTKLLIKCNKLDKEEKAQLINRIKEEKILTEKRWFMAKLS